MKYPKPDGFSMVPSNEFDDSWEYVAELMDDNDFPWEVARDGGYLFARFAGDKYFSPTSFHFDYFDRYIPPLKNTLNFRFRDDFEAYARFRDVILSGDSDYWYSIEKWLA